jgi:hypothetical protein
VHCGRPDWLDESAGQTSSGFTIHIVGDVSPNLASVHGSRQGFCCSQLGPFATEPGNEGHTGINRVSHQFHRSILHTHTELIELQGTTQCRLCKPSSVVLTSGPHHYTLRLRLQAQAIQSLYLSHWNWWKKHQFCGGSLSRFKVILVSWMLQWQFSRFWGLVSWAIASHSEAEEVAGHVVAETKY